MNKQIENKVNEPTAEQLDEIIESDGEVVADEEAETAFEEGFDANELVTGPDEKQITPEEDTEKKPEPEEALEASSSTDHASAPDAAEDATGQEDHKLTEQIKKLEQRVRKGESRYGELNSKLLNIHESARQEGKNSGIDTPTKKQIEEALQDGEKYKYLLEQFPEYAETAKEHALLIQKFISNESDGKYVSKSDLNTVINDAVDRKISINSLDRAHKGWEDTIKTSDFLDFVYENGPTPDERAAFYHLTYNRDPRAQELHQGFMDAYPEWGEKFGTLLNSPDSDDSIRLLDQFAEYQTAQKGHELTDNPRKEKSKKDRLLQNVAATKSSSRQRSNIAPTAEEAFAEGFGDKK